MLIGYDLWLTFHKTSRLIHSHTIYLKVIHKKIGKFVWLLLCSRFNMDTSSNLSEMNEPIDIRGIFSKLLSGFYCDSKRSYQKEKLKLKVLP